MKNLLIVIMLFLSKESLSQGYCAFNGNLCTDGMMQPSSYAIDVTNKVSAVLGVSGIQVFSSNTGNACATSYQGYPVITYNQNWFGFLHNLNPWAPISVIAHEVGHHINLDITWYGAFSHPWTKELRADYVSGYVMMKLGASLNDALVASGTMIDYLGSVSHPDTPKRVEAIRQGYFRALNGF